MIKNQRAGKAYNYPATDAFAEKVHTVAGVEQLAADSNIEKLLIEMEKDGHEVSAAVIELKALVNFVTHSRKINKECLTHVAFLANLLKK